MGTCRNYNLVNVQSEDEDTLIVQHLFTRIQHLLLFDDYLPAISLCFSVVENLPRLLPDVKDNLTLALRNFGEGVADDDDMGKTAVISYYHRAMCLYPDSELLRNNLGGFLFKIGHPETAIQHLRYILSQNPDYLKARENLENIYGFLVERWHFRMLNDERRNSCYRSAIKSVLKEISEVEAQEVPFVLDIGTGTGLLSMFAALASDRVEVYGCEMSSTMYKICGDVLKANHLDHRIQVINKASNSLSVPHDLTRKADLVITETFDCAFFGEHIVESLCHAWDNLMDDKCRVLPAKATVYVTAIECAAIRNQNRLLRQNLDGIDLNCIEMLCTTGNEHLRRIYQSHCDEFRTDSLIVEPDEEQFEPYSSEFLKRIPGGYRCLTQPYVLIEFLLDNPEQVKSLKDGIQKTIELKVTESGQLDAFVVWFDLHLSKDHMLTTSPVFNVGTCEEGCQQAVCWEQAVFPFLSNHLHPSQIKFSEDVNVVSGSSLTVDMRIDDRLNLTCHQIFPPNATPLSAIVNADGEETKELSGLTSKECNADDDLHCVYGHNDDGVTNGNFAVKNPVPKVVVFMERLHMSAINDFIYQRACFNALLKVKDQLITKGSVLRLVTLLSDALFLPIEAQKWFEQVLNIGLDESTQMILRKLMHCNGYSDDRLLFNSGTVSEIDKNWSVMFVDVVDVNGCLRQSIFSEIAITKNSRLLQSGIVIPSRVVVYGQLINSLSLMEDSMVINDERTQPFIIADFINEYRTFNHIGFDLSMTEYSAVTDAFEMFSFELNDSQFFSDSSPNNWKFCERCFNATALRTTTVTSLLYWFELNLVDDLCISTFNENCHWKQAAILIPDAPAVNAGDIINIKTICSDSYFNVDLKIQADNSV